MGGGWIRSGAVDGARGAWRGDAEGLRASEAGSGVRPVAADVERRRGWVGWMGQMGLGRSEDQGNEVVSWR
jgi:hypothetical protein